MRLRPLATLDLEDHRRGADPANRFIDNSARLIAFFDQKDIRATIFCVGDIVDRTREILRRAAGRGHEIGLHSVTHIPLTKVDRATYAAALRDTKMHLEDAIGQAVTGYRAPVFSLVPSTIWVTEVLAECGFAYSSSVLPAASPLYGFPGAPTEPFRWPSGVVEFPVPLAGIGRMRIPFMGGIYLRYLPMFLVMRLRKTLTPGVVPWVYVHPYDVDPHEPYFRFPGTSTLMSFALWRRRGTTMRRLSRVLDTGAETPSRTFQSLLEELGPASMDEFRPAGDGHSE